MCLVRACVFVLFLFRGAIGEAPHGGNDAKHLLSQACTCRYASARKRKHGSGASTQNVAQPIATPNPPKRALCRLGTRGDVLTRPARANCVLLTRLASPTGRRLRPPNHTHGRMDTELRLQNNVGWLLQLLESSPCKHLACTRMQGRKAKPRTIALAIVRRVYANGCPEI